MMSARVFEFATDMGAAQVMADMAESRAESLLFRSHWVTDLGMIVTSLGTIIYLRSIHE